MDTAVVVSECDPRRWVCVLWIEEIKHKINVRDVFKVKSAGAIWSEG